MRPFGARRQRTEIREQRSENRDQRTENRASRGVLTFLCPLSSVFCLLSSVLCLLSSVLCPLSSVLCSLVTVLVHQFLRCADVDDVNLAEPLLRSGPNEALLPGDEGCCVSRLNSLPQRLTLVAVEARRDVDGKRRLTAQVDRGHDLIERR